MLEIKNINGILGRTSKTYKLHVAKITRYDGFYEFILHRTLKGLDLESIHIMLLREREVTNDLVPKYKYPIYMNSNRRGQISLKQMKTVDALLDMFDAVYRFSP